MTKEPHLGWVVFFMLLLFVVLPMIAMGVVGTALLLVFGFVGFALIGMLVALLTPVRKKGENKEEKEKETPKCKVCGSYLVPCPEDPSDAFVAGRFLTCPNGGGRYKTWSRVWSIEPHLESAESAKPSESCQK